MGQSKPSSDTYTGPYTIIFLETNTEDVTINHREFQQFEAVDAFIDGSGLQKEDYIIVMGCKIQNYVEGK